MTTELAVGGFSDARVKDLFIEFLTEFNDGLSEDSTPKYRTKISEIVGSYPSSRSLIVDLVDVVSFNLDLAVALIQKPRTYLKIFDSAFVDTLAIVSPSIAETDRAKLHGRIRNLPDKTSLRQMDSYKLGKLVMLSGIITKTHPVKSITLNAMWKCAAGHKTMVPQDFSETSLLSKAWFCSTEGCELQPTIFDRAASEWGDFQNITIQEMPEDLPAGEIPRTFDVFLFDDVTDKARPGERVLLTAIMSTVSSMNSKALSQISENKLFGNHIEVIGRRPEDSEISKEEEEKFRSFATSIGAYDKLINSFDPAIFGLELQKEAILLQLAGSPQKVLPDRTVLRGDISILLVGDPGIAKSQLLKYTVNSAARGFYTTGMNSSSAGIGAAVLRDPNGGFVLEAGAAVLTDLGVLAIDELGKLSKENMGVLNEIMEQQTVSISKAGINVNLNARTSILAALNPVDAKYDPYKGIVDNINLPIPLLTRFDLIFILKDEPNPERDRDITQHIAQIRKNSKLPKEPPVDFEFMKRYLLFAKRINPELTDEAIARLQDFYQTMRKNADPQGLTVTPRWYEGLIRLTLARARLMLRDRTTEDDALRAVKITEAMLRTTATDQNTKKVDVGLLYNKPISEAGLREEGLRIFKMLSGEQREPVEDRVFHEEMLKTGRWSREQSEKVFKDMWTGGVIFEVRAHFFKKA